MRDDVIDMLRRGRQAESLQGLATFAYYTGWRIPSEVLPLQWAQVDRIAQTIRLEPGQAKNREGRTLPYGLLPELCDVIEAQWHTHEELTAERVICPWVFHRTGKPIREFRSAWRTACEVAGCCNVPHDFRRTAVRNLVRAGVPEKTAMQITGHKTRSVFDRYDIVNETDLRTAVGRLATLSGNATGTKQGQSGTPGRVARLRGRKTRAIA